LYALLSNSQIATSHWPTGKSSVINVLVGSSKHAHGIVRVGVASQPGKTKHFQTLLLPDRDDMMLCDCPGLVFPSFVSNTADLIAAGVYPIAQMRDHWPVINLICQRIPREIINAHYGIHLPVPSEQELRERGLTELPPPTAEEFLSTFCVARGMLAAQSGVPDFPRAARIVIKDYAAGKLLYCHAPPGCEEPWFHRETVETALKHTAKLREKLLRQQQHAKPEREEKVDEKKVDPSALVDDAMLDMLGGAPSQGKPAEKKQQKKGQFGKKGKKTKAHRHADPYGCHSASPDDMLASASAPSGVVVKAGKYSRSDYTRPTTYAGARSASTDD
jgi:large subunit GTPase 1